MAVIETRLVINPATTALADTSAVTTPSGQNAELLSASLHGKYYVAAKRGNLFMANKTAVTVPAIAATLVSVFSLYNPIASTRNLELVDMDIAFVVVGEVVNTIGLYYQGSPLAQSATFTTPGVIGTNVFAGNPVNGLGSGVFYSALTHSGTPVRVAIISQIAATGVTMNQPVHYNFDGKIIMQPGSVISVAMSTTVGTTSGTDLSLTWAEWPI